MNNNTLVSEDYARINEFYNDDIVYVKYCPYHDDCNCSHMLYINITSMIDNEDDADYFDNTLDLIDNRDNIDIQVGTKGVAFSLHELTNIHDDLQYKIGRQDGLTYLFNFIDHIYSE